MTVDADGRKNMNAEGAPRPVLLNYTLVYDAERDWHRKHCLQDLSSNYSIS